MQRDPGLRIRGKELEGRRHYAADLTVNAVDADHAAHDVGISGELSPPEAVAKHYRPIPPGLVVGRTKRPANLCADSEHGKQVRRERATGQAHGLTLSRKIGFSIIGIAGDVHHAALILE